MSHNLVQKRGRYPKTRPENNLAQGGWQAQTLSVPSQSQGFSEVDYNYQNQKQKVDAQHSQPYSNQWPEHQKVMNEEPQQKLDPNGHSVQQDVWNDWGDQGWENWDNNNSQQPQPTQSYYGQPQHQQTQSQQSVQYPAYDQGYHNQQEQQRPPLANHQTFEPYPQQVDQNHLSYPASCSTPHYQYNEGNSVPPFSPNAHLEEPPSGTQTAYSSQSMAPASTQPTEQIDIREDLHLQNQQQQYNQDTAFQQQNDYQQLQQSQPPLQNFNNLNYDQVSQHHQLLHTQQFPDYSQGYLNVGQESNIPEQNQFDCISEFPPVADSSEQKTPLGEYDSQPVTYASEETAGEGESLRDRNGGGDEGGNCAPYANDDLKNSPLISQEHKDEPISDSWDTLEDNMECLTIQDEPEESSARARNLHPSEVDSPYQAQQQEVQHGVARESELSQQSAQHDQQHQQDVHMQQNRQEQQQQQYPEHERQREQQRQPPVEEERQFRQQSVQREQHFPEEVQSPAVSALPSLSEVLQAKNLKSDSTGRSDSRHSEELSPVHDAISSPFVEAESKSGTASSSSSHSERRDSFDNAFDISSQERATFMADMVRPASEGAPAEEGSAASFPLPSPSPRPSNTYAEDSQNGAVYEPIAAREVVGQRASAERNAPAGLDTKAQSSVRQSPLGGEGGNLVPAAVLSKAPPEAPTANSESYRSGSQDERARSRRSARSSSSEDSEVAEHNREMMHQKMREREHELPAVSKRDQKWKNSRDRLRDHDYHSDESEVRKHRRRGNRDSDGERARRKYASDRDYEDDEYYDNRRYRRREDRKRDSDETEYASDRRHRYRSEDDTDAMGRPKRRSDEIRRTRNKKYPEDSDFDDRRSGRRGQDRKRREKRNDFYYNRAPSRDSSLNDSIVTSQISDSEVSTYDSRRARHTAFDRHPALGMHQVYDPRNFQSSAHGFPVMNSSMHPRQPQVVRSHPQHSQISVGCIPRELRGQDLQVVRHAYETDLDYRDVLDEYFVQCEAQGFDISQVRSYVCNGLHQSFTVDPQDLNESLTSSTAFAESSTRNEEPAPPEELRKYTRPHAFACFTSLNSLVKLHPSHRTLDLKPPVVEIHDLKLLLEDDPESKALAKFPGPLVRADTHKNQVIHFCNQRVNAIRKNKPYVDHIVDRESYVLLWELLILLLRQNGHVTGTDIAELLLKDAPYVDPASVQKLAEQEMSQIEESDKGSSDDSQTTVDGTRLNRAALRVRRQGLSHDQALSKFRELLLFGHRKEAIEHAIRYELWGHAFCLSSKMDIKLYTYVHSKFYQSFAGNDPLQTVYQLYSGRQPTSVTCVGDVTWGDWRPHLAMILANPSVRPEIDARSIVTMGDVLLSKGCLCAAHFCYLMAQVDFGEFQDKRCKLVLLGSNHMQSFVEFATNEAIVCTEIYEYAQSLSNPGYTLPTLGSYKYLHAKRLVDKGFVQEGLHYCERLAIDMVRNVDAYKPELIYEVYCLASRLRYNDAHYSHDAGNFDELGHPQWLMNLEHVNSALQGGLPIDRSLGSRRSSDFDGSNVKLEPQDPEPSVMQQQQQQQQLYQQPMQPANQLSQQVSLHEQPQVYDYYPQQQQDQTQLQQQLQPSYYSHHPNELPSHEELKEEEAAQATVTSRYSHEQYSRSSSADEFHQAPGAQAAVQEHPNPYNVSHQYGQRQSLASISSSITSASTNDSILRTPLAKNEMTQSPMKIESSSAQTSASTGKKSAPTSRAGQSWLNGIFKKILPRGPNQMILPDDKEQPIVWDSEKKVWVDRNADPAVQEASLAPPPSDLSLGAAPAPAVPLMSAPPSVTQDVIPVRTVTPQAVDPVNAAATPPSGSNRFQRIKSKPRYVDVVKQTNSTSPAVPPMAPIVPDGNVPQFMIPSAQPQFFVPTPPTGTQGEPFDLMTNRVDYEEQQQSHELDKQSGT